MRSSLCQTGVILRKKPYSESDEVVSVLLNQEGLVRFFARGSRKSKKRYQGLLDQFALLKFSYHHSRQGLARLEGVELLPGYANRQLWTDLKCFALGNYVAELIDHHTPDGNQDHRLFELWLSMQKTLQQEGFSIGHAVEVTEKFLEVTGYQLSADQSSIKESSKERLNQLARYSQTLTHKKSEAIGFLMQCL